LYQSDVALQNISRAADHLSSVASDLADSKADGATVNASASNLLATASQAVEAGRIDPAWDLARATLEKYWNRNLGQNYFIFWLSVAAIVMGWLVVVWAVGAGLNDKPAVVAGIGAGAGVLTQFIGATFLFIYRSTMNQALAHTRTLERINAVGMAWSILQSMSEEPAEAMREKDSVKAALAGQIVAMYRSSGSSPET
jgi:hypothetical protein